MKSIAGRCILILEDEYLIASQLAWNFEQAGAMVVGPLPSKVEALRTIDRGELVHAAVLDVRVSDGLVFPVAERLSAQGVPFVFYTGYSEIQIPSSLETAERFAKPTDWRTLSRALFEPPLPTVLH